MAFHSRLQNVIEIWNELSASFPIIVNILVLLVYWIFAKLILIATEIKDL